MQLSHHLLLSTRDDFSDSHLSWCIRIDLHSFHYYPSCIFIIVSIISRSCFPLKTFQFHNFATCHWDDHALQNQPNQSFGVSMDAFRFAYSLAMLIALLLWRRENSASRICRSSNVRSPWQPCRFSATMNNMHSRWEFVTKNCFQRGDMSKQTSVQKDKLSSAYKKSFRGLSVLPTKIKWQ